jgi:hypothetical protein
MCFCHLSMLPEPGLDWIFKEVSLGDDILLYQSMAFYSAIQASSNTYSIDSNMLCDAIAV